MHKEILTERQIQLLPMIKSFTKDFCLIGGTAAALQMGHRRSVDFDLISGREINDLKIRKWILKFFKIERVILNSKEEYTVVVNGVKVSFLQYPFKVECAEDFEGLKMPNLLVIAAMKAYALGRRTKWKDYVDLYFIIKNYFSTGDMLQKSKEIFGNEFNEKTFRAQLSYFKDIDYSEEINYLPGFETEEKIIQKSLVNYSLEIN